MDRREFIKVLLVGAVSAMGYPGIARGSKGKEGLDPSYLRAYESGLLDKSIQKAFEIMKSCSLCPRQCGVNRLKGEIGFCRSPNPPVVYSAHPHFGEETPLVGRGGSGTIFFSHCNLRCVFCQNWPIAHEGLGRPAPEESIADMMLMLQGNGCHNINLVTPTHVMPHILKAVKIAIPKGLRIPLVYNTSGYELTDIIKILDGIVDIYLPDIKYGHSKEAGKYSSGATDYPEMAKASTLEMHRQVGVLKVDSKGIASRGLIIRHLVMPNRVAGTKEVLEWIAKNLPKDTYVNIMPQYRVEYKAYDYPEIARGITVDEFLEAMNWAEELGLKNLDDKAMAVRDFYLRRKKS